MGWSRRNLALSNIKFIGQLVHSSLDRSRCLLSVRLRTKGRTGIEESEQGQLLNNDLIIAIKEHKERGGCGVKRDFFLNFNGIFLDIIFGSWQKWPSKGNITDPREKAVLGVMPLNWWDRRGPRKLPPMSLSPLPTQCVGREVYPQPLSWKRLLAGLFLVGGQGPSGRQGLKNHGGAFAPS